MSCGRLPLVLQSVECAISPWEPRSLGHSDHKPIRALPFRREVIFRKMIEIIEFGYVSVGAYQRHSGSSATLSIAKWRYSQ